MEQAIVSEREEFLAYTLWRSGNGVIYGVWNVRCRTPNISQDLDAKDLNNQVEYAIDIFGDKVTSKEKKLVLTRE